MCYPRSARGPEGLVVSVRMNITTVVAEVHCTCISLDSQAASSSKARAVSDSTDDSDDDGDSQDDDEDGGLDDSAHLDKFMDMHDFDCPSAANKKHGQVVSFLKVALVQGAEIQTQLAGLEESIASIKTARPSEPAQGHAQPAQSISQSFLADCWYNKAANAMFHMPLYQVKAVVSSRVKTGNAVVSVDEMMRRSERPERTWAAVKTLQPPSGNSTVCTTRRSSMRALPFAHSATNGNKRPSCCC